MAKIPIQIDSIFDGMMPSENFGTGSQFLQSLGIDPDVPTSDDGLKTGGFIRPVSYAQFSGAEIDAPVIAIINTPHSDLTWVILSNGKIIVYESDLTSANSHSIGQVAGNNARGACYYNNFIYIFGTGTSKNDISRVGPLNTLPYDGQTVNFTPGLIVTGATSGATGRIVSQVDGGATGTLTLDQINGIFLDNEVLSDGTGNGNVNRTFASLITNACWTGVTLGSQTALTDSAYPKTLFDIGYLNHYAFVHTDSLYFFDFVDGIGYVHVIRTTLGTNQGDTDDGCAYGVLDLPFGYAPVVGCSVGIDIAIAATPVTDTDINQGEAHVYYWNTSADSYYRDLTLPDAICSVLRYRNGTLRGISGSLNGGYNLWRYVGGDAIEVLETIEDGFPPLQGAADYAGSRMVWAANTTLPVITSGLYAYDSKSGKIPMGLHHIAISGFQ